MTVKEMHREVKISLDKVDSASLPEISPSELDFYLNEAIHRFVKTRYGRNNIYKRGYEEIQKRTEDLKAIVKTRYVALSVHELYSNAGLNVYKANLSTISDVVNNVRVLDTESKYMFFSKAKVLITSNGCSKWVKCELSQQDDFTAIAADPFNKALVYKPIVFFEDGNILIQSVEGCVVTDFLLTFIKIPTKVYLGTYPLPNVIFTGPVPEIACDLSEHTHKEIVQLAVTIILENIGSPRVQSQIPVNLNNVE
jgi:hypothetical protein